jgi:hypothetical protein
MLHMFVAEVVHHKLDCHPHARQKGTNTERYFQIYHLSAYLSIERNFVPFWRVRRCTLKYLNYEVNVGRRFARQVQRLGNKDVLMNV